jgi:glycerol-3-phosphate O-acyltransferase
MSKNYNQVRSTHDKKGNTLRLTPEASDAYRNSAGLIHRMGAAEVSNVYHTLRETQKTTAELALAQQVDRNTEMQQQQAIVDELDHEHRARDAVFQHALSGEVVRDTLQNTPYNLVTEAERYLEQSAQESARIQQMSQEFVSDVENYVRAEATQNPLTRDIDRDNLTPAA